MKTVTGGLDAYVCDGCDDEIVKGGIVHRPEAVKVESDINGERRHYCSVACPKRPRHAIFVEKTDPMYGASATNAEPTVGWERREVQISRCSFCDAKVMAVATPETAEYACICAACARAAIERLAAAAKQIAEASS